MDLLCFTGKSYPKTLQPGRFDSLLQSYLHDASARILYRMEPEGLLLKLSKGIYPRRRQHRPEGSTQATRA
jgi:hypothetical protein